MAKISIINRIKYSNNLYSTYYTLGNVVFNCLKWFVRCDGKLIVFASYGGRKMDDSPLSIYKKMIDDERFLDYKFVWAFINPEKHSIPRGYKIRIDTIKYYLTLLRARVWITNSSVTRGLKFKGRKTFYFNSWHGTPIKLMGDDIKSINKPIKFYTGKCLYDIFLSQGKYDANIFSQKYNIPDSNMKIWGLPRNDELIEHYSPDENNEIRHQLGVPEGKKIILYAPTFREYMRDEKSNCIIAPPINLEKWEKYLGDEYILLFRAHYEIVKVLNIKENAFVKDVSSYPILNVLIKVSDILVSDYSSIFFDYSITGKPMLCFAYDYKDYCEKRGLYFDIREELESIDINNEDILLETIRNLNYQKRRVITDRFRAKYIQEYGSSTIKSVDAIYEAVK